MTIATNMAGRGTDILLGGNPDFLSKEILRKKGRRSRHRGRRRERAPALVEAPARSPSPSTQRVVERGRPAHRRHRAPRVAPHRQPAARPLRPPGRSRLLALLPLARGRPAAHLRLRADPDDHGAPRHGGGRADRAPLVTRAIATAQKQVETHNFEIRKHLLEYDDVMNKQREIIYGMRRQILDGESQADTVAEWIEDIVAATLDGYAPADSARRGLGPGRARRGAAPAVRRAPRRPRATRTSARGPSWTSSSARP